MKELKKILFDIVGDYVDPSALMIDAKPRGYYWVISRVKAPVDPKVIYKEVEERLKGTEFEEKVSIYFPV